MNKIIESVDISSDGVDIVYRERSNTMLLCNPPRQSPDLVWKERWEIIDGQLTLVESIKGKHTPPQYIMESLTFDER
jgi:hypothetical protein